jgi:DNA replicative helicase MCM subunit Mcm2 (Cdc46/Mcm family)
MDNKIGHKQLNALRDKVKKENENEYLEKSKKRLQNIIETKIRTTFIGSLDIFEKAFGDLWGSGVDNPTSSQQEIKELWQQVRNDILDMGNNQLRAAHVETEHYTIKWDRYNMTIPVKPR